MRVHLGVVIKLDGVGHSIRRLHARLGGRRGIQPERLEPPTSGGMCTRRAAVAYAQAEAALNPILLQFGFFAHEAWALLLSTATGT